MSPYDMTMPNALSAVPSTGEERIAAAACHAGPFFGMPFLLPVAILLLFPVLRPMSPYVRHQAIQSVLFQGFVLIVGGTLTGVAVVFFHILIIGWPIAAVFGLAAVIFWAWAALIALIATFKAVQGVPYRLPVVGGFGS